MTERAKDQNDTTETDYPRTRQAGTGAITPCALTRQAFLSTSIGTVVDACAAATAHEVSAGEKS